VHVAKIMSTCSDRVSVEALCITEQYCASSSDIHPIL